MVFLIAIQIRHYQQSFAADRNLANISDVASIQGAGVSLFRPIDRRFCTLRLPIMIASMIFYLIIFIKAQNIQCIAEPRFSGCHILILRLGRCGPITRGLLEVSFRKG